MPKQCLFQNEHYHFDDEMTRKNHHSPERMVVVVKPDWKCSQYRELFTNVVGGILRRWPTRDVLFFICLLFPLRLQAR